MDLPDSDDEPDQMKQAEAVGRAAELDKATDVEYTYLSMRKKENC